MGLKRFCDICQKEIHLEREETKEGMNFYIIKAICSWEACKECAFKISDYISDNFIKETTNEL